MRVGQKKSWVLFFWRFVKRPDGAVRRIDAGRAPLSKHLPGCQSDGVVESIDFRWKIAGKDRAIIEQEGDAMIRMTGRVEDLSLNADLAQDLSALLE